MCDICYAFGIMQMTLRIWWTSYVAVKEINKGKYSGKVDRTLWLKVLQSTNLKKDGKRSWIPDRLGTKKSFGIWLEYGFHLERNLCVRGWMIVCTWVTKLPAELKANPRFSSIILVAVIAHLKPCLKGHRHRLQTSKPGSDKRYRNPWIL